MKRKHFQKKKLYKMAPTFNFFESNKIKCMFLIILQQPKNRNRNINILLCNHTNKSYRKKQLTIFIISGDFSTIILNVFVWDFACVIRDYVCPVFNLRDQTNFFDYQESYYSYCGFRNSCTENEFTEIHIDLCMDIT